MQKPVSKLLDDGKRLHLQHGPIDLIIGADACSEEDRNAAFAAARTRFDSILNELVSELKFLRSELVSGSSQPCGSVAQRMVSAAGKHCNSTYVTPMVAVAGAVSDEILETMLAARPLYRAYVNNGGDIALHLEENQTFSIMVADLKGHPLGQVKISHEDEVRGLATSGAGGRSHSLGIADSVTALASSAAEADAAATLIANAVDLPNHSGIQRTAAIEIQPDSDLGCRMVVTEVPKLERKEILQALEFGVFKAAEMNEDGKIISAALFLQQECRIVGSKFEKLNRELSLEHV